MVLEQLIREAKQTSGATKNKGGEPKMSELGNMFKEGRYEELWQRCCSFIDLSLTDFMLIQRRLLREQIEFLGGCELGQAIMRGKNPSSLEEFRQMVPLTTYDDYAPYLLEKREDSLPQKPVLWHCTSGKSGAYDYRWLPVTADQLEEIEPLIFALLVFSSSEARKSFRLQPKDKVLYGMAPPPYATGTMTRAFPYQNFRLMPAIDEAETMSFDERMRLGFYLSLSEGLDFCLSMSSVAYAIGRRFSQKGRQTNLKELLRRPKALYRLGRGMVRSKLAHRALLPRDIWSPKGLITYGIDGSVYREKIKEMWGRYPLDFHGCTEAVIIAMQTWDYQGMTFVPNLNFFEFIPEEESLMSQQDPSYQPETLLLDELKPGNYELVITNFHGGPLVRYRLGHLIKITALRNERLNIDIPQMVFLTRIDDQVDVAGFTRLSEKVIWQALENTGVSYVDWTVRKEIRGDKPVLHLYVEGRENGYHNPQELALAVHEELKKLDTPYADMEQFTGLMPLQVTLLPEGAFRAYQEHQRGLGAELSQLKPPHLNPSQEIIDYLMSPLAAGISGEREKVAAD
ncbi:MAG: GH3 auxin-responsive promoter family protein [Chloroflexota bacterium]